MISKLITLIVINMHETWIAQCHMIHKKFADSLEIEERVDLLHDLKQILSMIPRCNLLQQYTTLDINKLETIANAEIKRILFTIYSHTRDVQAYKDMNCRLKDYLKKINKYISEERFTIWESLLYKELELQCRYEARIDLGL